VVVVDVDADAVNVASFEAVELNVTAAAPKPVAAPAILVEYGP